MEVLEGVILNEEIDELTQRGIHRGYEGTMAKINGDIYKVPIRELKFSTKV